MAYTKHGRHIPGTDRDSEFEKDHRRVCPPECFPCRNESKAYHNHHAKEIIKMTGEQHKGLTHDYNDAPWFSAAPAIPLAGNFLELAKHAVAAAYRDRLIDTQNGPILNLPLNQIYVVWFVKTLLNWQAMLSSTRPDGMYYFVRQNLDEHNIEVFTYTKHSQVILPIGLSLSDPRTSFEEFATHAATEHHNGRHDTFNTSTANWVPAFQAYTDPDWKIVLRETRDGSALYEVTLNASAGEIYVDAYELVSRHDFQIGRSI